MSKALDLRLRKEHELTTEDIAWLVGDVLILLSDIEIDVQVSWQTDVLAYGRAQIPSAVFRLKVNVLFLATCEKGSFTNSQRWS